MSKLTDQEFLELHDMLDALVENNLPKDKLDKLEKWIACNGDVRMHYIEFMDMSASLHHYAEELIGDDLDGAIEEKPNPIISFTKSFLAIAAVLVLGLFFTKDFRSLFDEFHLSSTSDIQTEETLPPFSDPAGGRDTVAVLTKSVGIVWDQSADFQPILGDTLEAGLLQIESGLAQVEFLQGATVVLEGPVEFSTETPNEGSLLKGKLRAVVPKVATGFAINLPKGRVIDLGTDFGLNVHAGGSTELFVYEGKVIYEGQTDSGHSITRELRRGESIFIDPYGYANWVEMPSEPFISAADLAFRSMEESHRRHEAWVELSNAISADPKTILYFTFDNHSPWSRILKNESLANSMVQNGAIVGCKWGEGRWPGKGALSFNRQNDRVRLKLPSQLKSATFSAWIKLDSLKQDIAPILCSEPKSIGSTSWSINRTGQIVLSTRGARENIHYKSAVAFRSDKLSRWSHVVTTYNAKLGIISHYVNGRSFSREKLNEIVVLNFPKAMIGHSPAQLVDKKGLAFKGSIDEFGVFDGVLDELEIRSMYEIGRPFEFPNSIGTGLP